MIKAIEKKQSDFFISNLNNKYYGLKNSQKNTLLKHSQKYNLFLYKYGNNYKEYVLSSLKNKNNYSSKGSSISNIFDFFNKQKNKINFQNIFDEKGTRKFLKSKELAMQEIQIEEDIRIYDGNDCDRKTSKNISEDNDEFPKKEELKIKIRKEKTFSPRKKSVKFKNIKEQKNIQINKPDEIHNKGIDKSDAYDYINNDLIYKFILDNASESEDIFLKKLKEEINKLKKNAKIYNSSKKKNSQKESSFSSKKVKKMNPFNFSQTTKNLMSNENIDISSINSKGNISNYILEKQKTVDNNIYIKEKVISPEQESLLNVLSDLF